MVAKVFYKSYGLVCLFSVKIPLATFKAIHKDFVNGPYPLAYGYGAVLYCIPILKDIIIFPFLNAANLLMFFFSFGGRYSISVWIMAVYWREYFS